jgi:hypothetical protein
MGFDLDLFLIQFDFGLDRSPEQAIRVQVQKQLMAASGGCYLGFNVGAN